MKKIKKSLFRKHQKKVYYFGIDVEHPGYWLEMRLGKSRITIKDIIRFNAFPALIFCPNSAIKGWVEEIEIVTSFNNQLVKIVVITGTKKQRQELLKEKAHFYITNRECFRSIGDELAARHWGSVVLDESTCIANPKTRISRYMTTNFRNAKRRYILSGTAHIEKLINVFQQAQFLNENIFRECNNFYEFRHRYFVKMDYGYEPTRKNRKIILSRLAKHCFSMRLEDAGLKNTTIYEKKYYQLSKEVWETYENFAENFVLIWKNEIKRVTDYKIATIAPLRMLCSGFIKDEKVPGNHLIRIDDTKLNLLFELLSTELKYRKVLIWCNFIPEMEVIKNRLGLNGIDSEIINGEVKLEERNRLVDLFQKGKLQRLILHPTCFQYGATLNKADAAIYFSSPLSGETRIQTEKRMNDPFSKIPDLIIDLIGVNTLEQVIYDSVRSKIKLDLVFHKILKHLRDMKGKKNDNTK